MSEGNKWPFKRKQGGQKNTNTDRTNKNSPKPKKKRLTYKERAEQSLLAAVDNAEHPEGKPGKPGSSGGKVEQRQVGTLSKEELQKKHNSNNKPKTEGAKKRSSNKPKPKQSPQNKQQAKREPKNNSQPKQTLLYIDGENVFFQLFDVLRRKNLVNKREDLVKFDFEWLFNQCLNVKPNKVLYYGAKLKEIDSDPALLRRTQKMIDHKNRWIGYVTSADNVEYVNAGQLVLRKKGDDDVTFAEKGIDVSMAVDMLEEAQKNALKTVILWSSDSDLKPALLAMTKRNIKVVYMGRDDRINDVLAGTANETAYCSIDQIVEAYKRAN